MNLLSLTTVGIRLFALYSFFNGVFVLTPITLSLLRSMRKGDFTISYVWEVLNPLGIWILVGFLFWFLAPSIARFTIRGLPPEVTIPGLTLFKCYLISFVSMSIYFFVSHIFEALGWIHYLIKHSAASATDDSLNYYEAFSVFGPLLASIFLFIYAKQWALSLSQEHDKQNKADDVSP